MQRLITSCFRAGIVAGLALTAAGAIAAGPERAPFSPYVDAKGAITLPKDFRASWTHLGSWVVQQDGAPGQGFHDVYTEPASAASFRKTGQWPDGATLVKEIRAIKSGPLTTGPALWAGDNKVWFVMVKDSKGRHAGNGNWGDGWGWALFDAKNPSINAAASYQKDCIGCHTPAKATDWVFLQGYPTLAR